MSRSNAAPASSGDPIPRDVRALPSAPSLEYERKEAKALLKHIHSGEIEALRRLGSAHPVALRDRQPHELQLADAQHVIAREYGFTSWPRLVEYFEELERHRNAPRHNSSDDGFDRFAERAKGIVRRHQRGDEFVARQLAHFVPRFYARSTAEILATPITEDEARLVVAREKRRASWAELIERANASRVRRERQTWRDGSAPFERARQAILDHDAGALATILDEHPEILTPSIIEREWRQTLGAVALGVESKAKSAEARQVTDLLASRGVDIQLELDERLYAWPMDWGNPDAVRWYLDRGANPNRLPRNGITVLEHAMVLHKNGKCVDLIAERVEPRRALWIAAGLGDVAGVRGFIASKGTLTPEGRLNRPDPMAMGWFVGLPPHRDADDLEIMWEAFRIAGWNGRWSAMDALLEAGLPVDHAPVVWPLLIEAAGNMLVSLAEYLTAHGADVTRSWPSAGSARDQARQHFESNPANADARRLVTICGAGTPEAILAELDAKRQSPPPPAERTVRVMQLAADDATRQGQSAVTTENMLIGFLRLKDGALVSLLVGSVRDMAKLRTLLAGRLLPDADPLMGQDLPADTDAMAAVNTAAAEADIRRRDQVGVTHLLKGILSQRSGPGAQLLIQAGANEASLEAALKTML